MNYFAIHVIVHRIAIYAANTTRHALNYTYVDIEYYTRNFDKINSKKLACRASGAKISTFASALSTI